MRRVTLLRGTQWSELRAIGMAYGAISIMPISKAKDIKIGTSQNICRSAVDWVDIDTDTLRLIVATPSLPRDKETHDQYITRALRYRSSHASYRTSMNFVVLVRSDRRPPDPNYIAAFSGHRVLEFNDQAFIHGFREICGWYQADPKDYLHVFRAHY
jgi:hypothetical protein